MKKNKLLYIGVVLIMLLAITPAVNSINLQTNKTDGCGCSNSEKIYKTGNTDYYYGLLPGGNALPPKQKFVGNSPSSWDWRNAEHEGKKGDWTTPIKDQDQCGSCYAFGSYASMESCIKIKSVNPSMNIDLSEQYMVSCGMEWKPNDIKGCDGAYFTSIFDFIREYGTIPDSCFPYTSDDGSVQSCSEKCSDWEDLKININGWKPVDSSISSIKTAIYDIGPVAASMRIYDDFSYYKSGVYEPKGNLTIYYHLISIVGYNDNPGYWICKNSWGTGWGESGWFKIKYSVCEIEEKVACLDVNPIFIDNSFEVIQNGNEYTTQSNGDIDEEGDAIRMACGPPVGDATRAFYSFVIKGFDIDNKMIAEGIQVGLDTSHDTGFFQDGPQVFIYDWKNKAYNQDWDELNPGGERNEVWITVINSKDYVSDNGEVNIYVRAEEEDCIMLYRVGVRGRFLVADLECEGDLNFGTKGPGQTTTRYITVKNVGDPSTELDWEVSSWPDWGSWSFSPQSGDNLKPEYGPKTITVKLTTPTTEDSYSGSIIIINKNDVSDSVSLTTTITVKRSRPVWILPITSFQEKFQPLIKLFSFFKSLNNKFPKLLDYNNKNFGYPDLYITSMGDELVYDKEGKVVPGLRYLTFTITNIGETTAYPPHYGITVNITTIHPWINNGEPDGYDIDIDTDGELKPGESCTFDSRGYFRWPFKGGSLVIYTVDPDPDGGVGAINEGPGESNNVRTYKIEKAKNLNL